MSTTYIHPEHLALKFKALYPSACEAIVRGEVTPKAKEDRTGRPLYNQTDLIRAAAARFLENNRPLLRSILPGHPDLAELPSSGADLTRTPAARGKHHGRPGGGSERADRQFFS